MTKAFGLRTIGAMLIAVAAVSANAADLMPDFSSAPTGWTTDRYEPNSFTRLDTYQGRSDVLEIGISRDQSLTLRPSAYQSTFYNTQGRQYAITGGAGSSIAADLFINAGWVTGVSGKVRTDMWGVMTDATEAISTYPIIGFTNDGGARYRVWDEETADGWVDLQTAVAPDAWTSFEILFTANSLQYFINDLLVYTDATIGGSTGFSAVIMQAYNFADSRASYTANWSNDQNVPEPTSMALFGLALAGLAVARRRKSI